MTSTDSTLDFLFLGNTSFGGLSQREHALATELARTGYPVTYVEGMPSIASRLQEASRRLLSPESIEQADLPNNLPPTLKILTPPVVPTFFRSSYTPAIDKSLFRKWFHKQFQNCDWSNTVLMVMFPYWWDGFDERFFHYFDDTDVCTRIVRAGFSLDIAAQSIVQHNSSPRKREKALTSLYYLVRNHLLYAKKHLSRVDYSIFRVAQVIFFPWRFLRLCHRLGMQSPATLLRAFKVWWAAWRDFTRSRFGPAVLTI